MSHDRRLVLVDQSPLRESAGKEARKKMREVNKLSATLAEFERTIRPTYERWEREHLAPLLDEERRLTVKIAELEHLIQHASMEALFTDGDPYEILARERKALEKQHGDSAHDSGFDGEPKADSGFEKADPYAEQDANRPEEERDFRSYIRFLSGEDPDSLGAREYTRLFQEYRRWRERMGATSAASRKKITDIPARIKEIYRVLVRRLHPDAGQAAPDPHIERLWHDLQEAYAAMDLERMEVLLAITDLQESGDALRSTLYHLRKVAKEMARTVRELKSRFRQVSASEAWIFWHAEDRAKAGEKIRATIVRRIAQSKSHLSLLEEDIEHLKMISEARKASVAQTTARKKAAALKLHPFLGSPQPEKNPEHPSIKNLPRPTNRTSIFNHARLSRSRRRRSQPPYGLRQTHRPPRRPSAARVVAVCFSKLPGHR